MALKGNPANWDPATKIGVIYANLRVDHPHTGPDCLECKHAGRELYHSVGEAPLIFKTKIDGIMVTLPKGKERWTRFMNLVREVHAYAAAGNFESEASEKAPEGKDTGCGGCDNGECCQNGAAGSACDCCGQPIPDVKPPYVKPQNDDFLVEAEAFYTAVQHRRAFVRGRKGMESLDSMRIVIDGVNAIRQGVPKEALISAIEAPWPTETIEQCRNFRPTSADLKPVKPAGSYDYAAFAPRPSKFAHGVSEYVSRLVNADVLVWLHGPAGTGKSSAAKYAAQIHAERCGLTGEKTEGRTYFEVNCAGAMVSAVKGRDKLNSTVISDFMLAYEFGGTINLEEFDSAHPSVGTFLGTALAAKDGFVNDILCRFVKRHKDFRCIVTANSLGYGSAEFKRNDLDGATKDRFRVGRTYVGLDLTLERSIFESLTA